MKSELHQSCEQCPAKPELLAFVGESNACEARARSLGFEITEGSVSCGGISRIRESDKNACIARMRPTRIHSIETEQRAALLKQIQDRISSAFYTTERHLSQI